MCDCNPRKNRTCLYHQRQAVALAELVTRLIRSLEQED